MRFPRLFGRRGLPEGAEEDSKKISPEEDRMSDNMHDDDGLLSPVLEEGSSECSSMVLSARRNRRGQDFYDEEELLCNHVSNIPAGMTLGKSASSAGLVNNRTSASSSHQECTIDEEMRARHEEERLFSAMMAVDGCYPAELLRGGTRMKNMVEGMHWKEMKISKGQVSRDRDPNADMTSREILEDVDGSPTRGGTVREMVLQEEEDARRENYLRSIVSADPLRFQTEIRGQINNQMLANRNFLSITSTQSCLDSKLWFQQQNKLMQEYNLRLDQIAHLYRDLMYLEGDMHLYSDDGHYFNLSKMAYLAAHGTRASMLPNMEPRIRAYRQKLDDEREAEHSRKKNEYNKQLGLNTLAMIGLGGGRVMTPSDIGGRTGFQSTFAKAAGMLLKNKAGDVRRSIKGNLRSVSVGRNLEGSVEEDRDTDMYRQNQALRSSNVVHYGQAIDCKLTEDETQQFGRATDPTAVDYQESVLRGRKSAAGWDATQKVAAHEAQRGVRMSVRMDGAQGLFTEEPSFVGFERESHGPKQNFRWSAWQPKHDDDYALNVRGGSQGGSSPRDFDSRMSSLPYGDSRASPEASPRGQDEVSQGFNVGTAMLQKIFAKKDKKDDKPKPQPKAKASAISQKKRGSVLRKTQFGPVTMAILVDPDEDDPNKKPGRHMIADDETATQGGYGASTRGNGSPTTSRAVSEAGKDDDARTDGGENENLSKNEKKFTETKMRQSQFEHPLYGPGDESDDSDGQTEADDPFDGADDSIYAGFITRKKIDPLEKIRNWKPKKKRMGKYRKYIPVDGDLINKSMVDIHERYVHDEIWEEFKKNKHTFFIDERNPIIRDVLNILYHQLTNEEMIMCNFLTDLLERSRQQLAPFRAFDMLHIPKKHESLFRSEGEALQKRKIRRQIAKCCAALSLRGLRDVIHLTEDDWNRGRLPLRLITVKKKEIMAYLSDELSDMERASFWKSIAETQRNFDHKRSLGFPAKHQQLERSDLGTPPYKNWWSHESPKKKQLTTSGAKRQGGSNELEALWNKFDQKVGGRN